HRSRTMRLHGRERIVTVRDVGLSGEFSTFGYGTCERPCAVEIRRFEPSTADAQVVEAGSVANNQCVRVTELLELRTSNVFVGGLASETNQYCRGRGEDDP